MYELIVVSTNDAAASLFEKVEKFLKEASAENVKTEKMGRKALAYPIAKNTEAEYFLFNFDAPGAEILGIDKKLRLEQEGVLRHLLIKTKPVKAKKAYKAAKAPEVTKVAEEPKVEVKPKVTVTTKVTISKKEEKPVKSKPVKKGTSKK